MWLGGEESLTRAAFVATGSRRRAADLGDDAFPASSCGLHATVVAFRAMRSCFWISIQDQVTNQSGEGESMMGDAVDTSPFMAKKVNIG